ncbi:MAG TPA: YfbM family protein [Candidatus Binataceae bacterium]|nr:YfbM family protein [Candidatus Binataceae bacterium]
MSMTATFVQVTAAQLAELVEDSDNVEGLFMDDAAVPAMGKLIELGEAQRQRVLQQGPQMLEAALSRFDPQTRETLQKRLGQLGIDPSGLAQGSGGEALLKLMTATKARLSGGGVAAGQGASASPRGRSLSIDKSWHGVHYLLCGAPEPNAALISKVVLGGTELGDDFSGYGEARYFDAGETAAIASELGRPTLEAEMTRRYDPAQMKKLEIYPGGWSGPDLQWLMREFGNLRSFYADAAAKGLAMVTCLV